MKSMLSKLRGRAGESISETLVALLISALALMMLAGAVSSASNIVTKSNKALSDYYGSDEGNTTTAWSSAISAKIGE